MTGGFTFCCETVQWFRFKFCFDKSLLEKMTEKRRQRGGKPKQGRELGGKGQINL